MPHDEPENPILPFLIGWFTVQDENGNVWESATCYFNGCGDGGKAVEGSIPRTQAFFPSVILGLSEGFAAACIRKKKEVAVHTATWQNHDRIRQALQGPPKQVEAEGLVDSKAISVGRIATAPIAFFCKLLHEIQLGDGRVAFILRIVAFHVDRKLMVGGFVDMNALQAIGAQDIHGKVLLQAREEHLMTFPSELDSDGHWIVPPSELLPPRTGDRLDEDLVWEPPFMAPLPHNPFKALIVPRPVGWISTRGENGDNLSPYSFFNYLASDIVCYAVGGAHVDGGEKDALRDARFSGVFCVNVCPWNLRRFMSASACECPHHVDEFSLPMSPIHPQEELRLTKTECRHIDAPCVAVAAAATAATTATTATAAETSRAAVEDSQVLLHLECKVIEFLQESEDIVVVIGKVVHVAGSCNGPVTARAGYFNYFRIAEEHSNDMLW
eukprot:TRINITY_DN67797_c0_g1_i1.p1 TRINITY_DN67797_c0_g1~~TRINITY_DN67797_c0_g1_i1.p1  ORF type:complete len:441 (-),score=71.56 TRINITY_DN67797_c0_g1_i1:226-1548(-)